MESTQRHPVRGAIWGVILGLGLALIAIGQSWAALGTWPPFVILLAGTVIGIVWSTFGPAKPVKSEASGGEPKTAGEPQLVD
jgi:hypothetical protein